MHLLGVHVDATGNHGKRGHNVQHLVVVDTGTEQEKLRIGMSLNVMVLPNVQAMTWGMIMIMLAIQFAIMGHIIVDGVIAQQDGLECVAAIVCMKFSFCINEVPQVNKYLNFLFY